jgi:hypothetical protein
MTRRLTILVLALALAASAFAQGLVTTTPRQAEWQKRAAIRQVSHPTGMNRREFENRLVARAADAGVSVSSDTPPTVTAIDTLLLGGNGSIFAVSGMRSPNRADSITIVGFIDGAYFNSVAAVTSGGSHSIFGSAGSYLYRFNDPGSLNVATDINKYLGMASLDALYANSAGQIVGVNNSTPELIRFGLQAASFSGNTSVASPNSAGLVAVSKLPNGGVLALDPFTGFLFYSQSETDPNPTGIASLSGPVNFAVDGNNIYFLLASSGDPNDSSQPYAPAAIIRTTMQFGFGGLGMPTLTPFIQILSGGALSVSFGPHGMVAHNGRLYWFQDSGDITFYDTNTYTLNLQWFPAALANGATSLALNQ